MWFAHPTVLKGWDDWAQEFSSQDRVCTIFLGHVECRLFHQKFSLIPGFVGVFPTGMKEHLAETHIWRCSWSIPTKSVKTMNVREHLAIRKWNHFESIIHTI